MKLFAVLVIALILAVPTWADDKTEEVKGSLVVGEKTYKFAHAVAYKTQKSDKKRTVVMLTVKPPKLDKLTASLKDKGDDSDFFSFDDNLKLVFDEKGELYQTVIFVSPGKNINNIGDDNVKATFKLADGAVKGTAKTAKPDEAFGEKYHFEVAFDVKVLKP